MKFFIWSDENVLELDGDEYNMYILCIILYISQNWLEKQNLQEYVYMCVHIMYI